MRMENMFRAFGQALGEALAESGKFKIDNDDEHWDILANFAFEDARPTRLKIALSRRDTVQVSVGDTPSITVTGDEEGHLRFRLVDGTLKIARRGSAAEGARVMLTLPALERIAIAGSGTVEADTLAADAAIAIGGAGTVKVGLLANGSLSAKIGGSGTIEAAGAVERFDLRIGGSGKVDAPGLEVTHAKIAIGGSGKVEFSSDGEVDARIGGSGDILVHGTPRCSIRAGGSGRLRSVPRSRDTSGAA